MQGVVRADVTDRLVLVLPDGSRVPVDTPLTIGRAEAADVRIADRTVSRRHAKVTLGQHGATVEDVGSRSGTTLSGELLAGPMPLHAGAVIGLGDVRIRVEGVESPPRRELASGPSETVVV